MTRKLIVAAAQATKQVEVLRGVEVTERLSNGKVTCGVAGRRGTERLEFCADLVVGDDGMRSFVRSSLGIPIELREFPIDFITAVVRWPSAIPPDCSRAFLNFQAFRDGLPAISLIPWPAGQGALLIPLPPSRADALFGGTPNEFGHQLAVTAPLVDVLREQVEFPGDFVRVTRPFGHAASDVSGGIALMGNAAHPMTPAGGPGANASIWDALTLAKVADETLQSGNLSRERPAPYEHRRRPINAQSVDISRTALTAFRLGRHVPLVTVVPLALRVFEGLVWPKREFLRRFSTTFADRESNSL